MIQAYVDPNLGYGIVTPVYGGENLTITANPDLVAMLAWWQEWRPVFASANPAVRASLEEIKLLHQLSK